VLTGKIGGRQESCFDVGYRKNVGGVCRVHVLGPNNYYEFTQVAVDRMDRAHAADKVVAKRGAMPLGHKVLTYLCSRIDTTVTPHVEGS